MKIYNECKVCLGQTLKINKKYNLLQCQKCQIIFCENIFTQSDFIKVYDNLYNKEDTHYQKHSQTEFNKLMKNEPIKVGLYRSNLIKKNVLNTSCKSVLEIGSGIGLIGSYINQKNKNIDYLGIELDKEAFDKSQRLNINAINGDFTIMDKIDKTFDIIMLWEVIEHLQDLKLFIELAYKKLNNNGKIILSTPNYNKIYNYPNRIEDAIYQDAPPVHLNFFTPNNLKNIFELISFTNCKVIEKKYPYLHLKSIGFYKNVLKAIFNKHNGTSLYFEAQKKVL